MCGCDRKRKIHKIFWYLKLLIVINNVGLCHSKVILKFLVLGQFEPMCTTLKDLWYHCLILFMYVAWHFEQFFALKCSLHTIWIHITYVEIAYLHFDYAEKLALWGNWGIITYFPQSSDLYILQDVSIRFVQLIEDKVSSTHYAICHVSIRASAMLTFSPPPQHCSISFTMTLCCCALWWPWLHASCLSVDSVAAGAIGIVLAFSVALLVLQKTPSYLDGSSSSTHSNKQQPLWIFVSLGQSWNPAAVASVFSCHILQCIILLALQQ